LCLPEVDLGAAVPESNGFVEQRAVVLISRGLGAGAFVGDEHQETAFEHQAGVVRLLRKFEPALGFCHGILWPADRRHREDVGPDDDRCQVALFCEVERRTQCCEALRRAVKRPVNNCGRVGNLGGGLLWCVLRKSTAGGLQGSIGSFWTDTARSDACLDRERHCLVSMVANGACKLSCLLAALHGALQVVAHERARFGQQCVHMFDASRSRRGAGCARVVGEFLALERCAENCEEQEADRARKLPLWE